MSGDANTIPGRWWQMLGDGRVQCDLCPRECRLHDGQRGFCFVRERQGDGMVLTTYGRSSGFCVDPIEKKPLAHFLPGTSVLSFGTAGCNLGCKFCQNWDISKAKDQDRLADQASPEAIARTAKEMGCRSVAFTYNDPTIFAEYALDVADACHASGIKTVAVSAGYISPAPRAELYAKMDAANIDLKGFTEDFYWKITSGHLEPVLDTLRYIKHETKTWLEITTLLIPGLNDDERELHALCAWVRENLGRDVPLHFSAFHPDFRMLDVPPTPPATLKAARRIALEEGLHFAYTGNVHDVEGDTTYCPGCGDAVIVRDWYRVLEFRLSPESRCPRCLAGIDGIFEDRPGTFGRRRIPVAIVD